MAESPSGVLNCVGLQNPGLENVLAEQLPWVLQHDLVVLQNIAGGEPADYARLAEAFDQVEGLAGLEVNISCPNVKAGFPQDPGSDPYGESSSQAPYRSFPAQAENLLIPLFVLSPAKPLRWVSLGAPFSSKQHQRGYSPWYPPPGAVPGW